MSTKLEQICAPGPRRDFCRRRNPPDNRNLTRNASFWRREVGETKAHDNK